MSSFSKGDILFFNKNFLFQIPADILLSFVVSFFVKGFPERPEQGYKSMDFPAFSARKIKQCKQPNYSPSKKTFKMEKKIVPPMTVIKHSMETTMATLIQDIGEIPRELDAKIVELGLEATGPHTWVYFCCDGSADAPFKLDIAIPVKEAKGDAGRFSFEQLPEFTCVVTEHKGPWSTLMKTYEQFVPEILKSGIQMSGFSREIYHLCDFVNPENCITEIQIGII